MPDIIDAELGKLATPARIDHETLEIQISSRQFRPISVPQRIVIGVHEYTHPEYDTKDETFCDLNACRICLGLRFPATEITYAFTSIFGDDEASKQRIIAIQNYINRNKFSGNNGRLW